MNDLNTKIIISTNENNFTDVETLLHKILPNINAKRIEDDYSKADVIMVQPGKAEEVMAVAKSISTPLCVIFSYEDAVLSQAMPPDFKKITYGFSPEADFFASDENVTDDGFTFKLTYKGSTIPIWVKRPFSKDEIYVAMSFVSIAAILGFNVVEISEVFKN
jgi:hypothetical protein